MYDRLHRSVVRWRWLTRRVLQDDRIWLVQSCVIREYVMREENIPSAAQWPGTQMWTESYSCGKGSTTSIITKYNSKASVRMSRKSATPLPTVTLNFEFYFIFLLCRERPRILCFRHGGTTKNIGLLDVKHDLTLASMRHILRSRSQESRNLSGYWKRD
jgi:hypothetical protein